MPNHGEQDSLYRRLVRMVNPCEYRRTNRPCSPFFTFYHPGQPVSLADETTTSTNESDLLVELI